MSDKELKDNMNLLYKKFTSENTDVRWIIGKAVQLGMDYQEQKIYDGIKIVFDALHDKNG